MGAVVKVGQPPGRCQAPGPPPTDDTYARQMRRVRRAIVVLGVAAVALLLPITSARGPGTGVSTGPAQPETVTGSFSPEQQLAHRKLQDPALSELSGLAASRVHPGVLYGINDSGNEAVVFAIDDAGKTVARLTLPEAGNYDWEALAPGRDREGRPVLWIGDIGDNLSQRSSVRLLRIAEPTTLQDRTVTWQEFRVAYPDGPHNAEGLAIDPRDGTMWIVTKRSGGPGGVYRVPDDLRSGRTAIMERVMDAPSDITDAAWELSPAAEPRLVLTGYFQLHSWNGASWTTWLGPLQLQREAVAWPWLPSGQPADTILLGSEGSRASITTSEVPPAGDAPR